MSQPRQRAEGTRHSYFLSRRTEVEPDAPAEPVGAGAEPGVPATAGVEVANEVEQARGRDIEVRRQLGDLVTQTIQRAFFHGVCSPVATLHRGFRTAWEAPPASIAVDRRRSRGEQPAVNFPGFSGSQEACFKRAADL